MPPRILHRRDILRYGLAGLLSLATHPLAWAVASERLPVTGFGARTFDTPVPLHGTPDGPAMLEACQPLAVSIGPGAPGGNAAPFAFTMARNTAAALEESSHPGSPLLRLQSGCTFRARVSNKLTTPCTPFWRGLLADWQTPLPASPLESGAEHTYAATVRNRAGTLLYQALTPGMAAPQVQLGLCGLMLVEDATERLFARQYDLHLGTTDLPLLIHDCTLDRLGAYATTQAAFGNALLVNGVIGGVIDVPAAFVRLRLANGCASRILDVALQHAGKDLPVTLIGTDCGLLPVTERVEGSFLGPGERVEYLADLRDIPAGTDIYLVSRTFPSSYFPGRTAIPPEGTPFALLRLRVGAPTASRITTPAPMRLAEPFAPLPAPGGPARRASIVWPHGLHAIDGQAWTDTPLQLPHRQRETWEFSNAADGVPYPLYCGGLAFRVLTRRGGPPAVQARATHPEGRHPADEGLKDTVIIWPGETVRISLDFSVRRAPAAIPLVFGAARLDAFDAGQRRTIVLPPLTR
ncbi:multicopper oxidase family protein [Nitratidesulfovibrio vulgaris]|uniref:multicopper oxidase family protein n=1 Tax=Nitratidesulfovibrio vulgaris TaxID=881 RepID=UPI0013DF7D18|nr:multicopper oxidase domain-containing protein [Nitratidesulfovibrio vulgaris]